MRRVKNPADDHESAAQATRIRPSRCCCCSWSVMGSDRVFPGAAARPVNLMATLLATMGLTDSGVSIMVRAMNTAPHHAVNVCGYYYYLLVEKLLAGRRLT